MLAERSPDAAVARLGRELLAGSRPAADVVTDLGASGRAEALAYLAGLLRDPVLGGAVSEAVAQLVAACAPLALLRADADWHRRTRWQDPNWLRPSALRAVASGAANPLGVLTVAAMTDTAAVRRRALRFLPGYGALAPTTGLRIALLRADDPDTGVRRAALLALPAVVPLLSEHEAAAAAPLAARLTGEHRSELHRALTRLDHGPTALLASRA